MQTLTFPAETDVKSGNNIVLEKLAMDHTIECAYRDCVNSLKLLASLQDDENSINNTLEQATSHVKVLRNSCALGPLVQEGILQLPEAARIFEYILFDDDIKRYSYFPSYPQLQRMCWQFMANLCVQNTSTQSAVWAHFGDQLVDSLRHQSPYKNIQLMIVYNIFQSGSIQSYDKTIFQTLLKMLSENTQEICEYLEIFLEYFLTSYHRAVFLYSTLSDHDRILALHYIAEYLRQSKQSKIVNGSLLTYLSKEVKKKSDCILRTHTSDMDPLRPQEILALLDVIALASGSEEYAEIYRNDHSLFINIGGLLQQLKAIGESSQNIFTPMKKLEQVAPNSNIKADFEKEVSFKLKTTLVRILANLSYKNSTNQEYARDMGILVAILECTTADGRNPLIKEWSILAIRNLCEKCPENQELISKLSKVGDAENEVLKELNLELGSLRIQ